MGLSGKDVNALEQGFMGIADQLIPGLWTIYTASVKEGFTPEQAMQLTVGYQQWMLQQCKGGQSA